MNETLFDDTYTGPRFTYGLNYRPLATAQVPAGYVIFSNRTNSAHKFGTVDYPRELTPDEVNHFQLSIIL